jgi:two-component system response regulator
MLRTILLVEDTATDARIFEHFFTQVLRTEGYTCRLHWVRDPIKAEEFLLDPNLPMPDLIILDIGFNGLNTSGLDYLGKLKTNKKYTSRNMHLIPVVILTATDDEHDINLAYDRRANAYFVKPIEGEDNNYSYQGIIQILLQFWRRAKLPVLTN